MGGWTHSSTGTLAEHLYMVSIGSLSTFFWVLQLISSPLGHRRLLLSWYLVLSSDYHSSPFHIAIYLHWISWPSILLPISLHTWFCTPFTLRLPLPLRSLLCSISHDYFVSPSKLDRSIHIMVFLLLMLHMVCEISVGILSFLPNIHWSVSTYLKKEIE